MHKEHLKEYSKYLFDLTLETLEEWKKENPPEKIKQELKAQLDANKLDIIRNMLGYQRDYGNYWSLTNMEKSPLYEPIAAIAKQQADELISGLKVRKPTAGMIKQLNEDVERRINHYLETKRKDIQRGFFDLINIDEMIKEHSKVVCKQYEELTQLIEEED